MSTEDSCPAYDIVVVGYGAAGAMAAIEAHDAGAKVLLIEKMPDPGGLSIVSAGGVRMAFDREEALAYLLASCGGRTPADVLEALADGMAAMPSTLERLLPASGATMKIVPAVGNYPLPGYQALGYVEIDAVPALNGLDRLHAVEKLTAGCRLFKVLEDNVAARAIDVWLECPAERLILEAGVVSGVRVRRAGRAIEVAARRAVILTCGGFEADEDMKKQYFQATPVLPGSYLGNAGDGIRMAQAAGADLWHMWHYHGPYGLRHPDPTYPFALYLKAIPMWTPGASEAVSDLGVTNPASAPKSLPRLAWILCDQTGARFMDEYPPYPGDFGVRPLDHYDSKSQRFPRIPAFMIFDDAGRAMYPLGRAVQNARTERYVWSADNLREVELGIFVRAESLDELAAKMEVPAERLHETIASWNAACAKAEDSAFGRRPETMAPIETPPFYFGRVWPVAINTQGGPVHDRCQRVLNAFGEIIPGLYAAGELGSAFGHLYLSGGNLAECIVGGGIAARHAAALPVNR